MENKVKNMQSPVCILDLPMYTNGTWNVARLAYLENDIPGFYEGCCK